MTRNSLLNQISIYFRHEETNSFGYFQILYFFIATIIFKFQKGYKAFMMGTNI